MLVAGMLFVVVDGVVVWGGENGGEVALGCGSWLRIVGWMDGWVCAFRFESWLRGIIWIGWMVNRAALDSLVIILNDSDFHLSIG